MSFIEDLKGVAFGIVNTPVDFNVRYSFFYLVATVLLAQFIWLARGKPDRFLRWLLPSKVFFHRSNLLDIKLFIVNRVISLSGILGPLLFAPAVAFYVVRTLSGKTPALDGATPESLSIALIATLIVVVSADFCKYWAHRMHHEWKALWPFHAVHHSAEVLTPLTLMRAHPMEAVLRNIFISLAVGLVQGLFLWLFLGPLALVTVAGANVFYFLFNTAGANLRHSHIWLSYGRVLEHVFISPAQHQVHHSIAIEHHDKNYGSIFALWDWMFGTLYVPDGYEELKFGVAGKEQQPHPNLRIALLSPFAESWAALRSALNQSSVTKVSEQDRL
ncbi:sterol desaturase family protein [uncultured Litoreibacter sp.]|uniref:sterol desaturase family protein n=1 Tax=uncultured Litoreibacter sp. TaxID=1392394 RepID=UPI00263333CD|nr:sterol desaturase family protein [uncultured Litoreibacter sp.]